MVSVKRQNSSILYKIMPGVSSAVSAVLKRERERDVIAIELSCTVQFWTTLMGWSDTVRLRMTKMVYCMNNGH